MSHTAPSLSAPREPMKWRGRVAMLGQFISKPSMIGAVAPSSIHLAREMVRGLDLGSAAAVLEYGPGTGVFTDVIAPKLGKQTKFAAIELNQGLARAFKTRHPTIDIVNDSVENVRAICDARGIDRVDYILSGLPWASFSDDLQARILSGIDAVLKPGGMLVTFGYHVGTLLPAGKRFYRRIPKHFSKIHKSTIIWRNIPPAFVVRCEK